MKKKNIISIIILIIGGCILFTVLYFRIEKNVDVANVDAIELSDENEIMEEEQIEITEQNEDEEIVIEDEISTEEKKEIEKPMESIIVEKKENKETVSNVNKNSSVSSNPVTTKEEKETVISTPTETKVETKVESKAETKIEEPKVETIVRCTNNNNHGMNIGNSNKWFASKNEAIQYYNSQLKYWGDLWDSFQIESDAYYKNCPSGYEVWSCMYCSKWTINFYYR